MRGELRHRLQVFERGHGAQAGLAHVLAAELHGERIGRAEAVRRIVAGGAGHPAGGRQQRVDEQPLAERGERRGARKGLRRASAPAPVRPRGAGQGEQARRPQGQRRARRMAG